MRRWVALWMGEARNKAAVNIGAMGDRAVVKVRHEQFDRLGWMQPLSPFPGRCTSSSWRVVGRWGTSLGLAGGGCA